MFMDEDFLLDTEWAKKLFHGYAESQPIIDYHCHLDPAQILEDRRFKNITQVWLNDNGAGDHYKWRLMRANGVPEEFVSGDGDDWEKFLAYAKTIESAPGNPLYEWGHLELRRVFGIDLTISEKNAPEIWERANERIAEKDFSARGLIRRFNVRCLCTTDDITNDLAAHRRIAGEIEDFRVLPTFRPDSLWNIASDSFIQSLSAVSKLAGIEVTGVDGFEAVLAKRSDAFHEVGCRLADLGMDDFHYTPATREEIEDILGHRLVGQAISEKDEQAYQTYLTLVLMELCRSHGWTLQLHMNCMRNDSTRGFEIIGRDAGFDSVGNQSDIVLNIKQLLDMAQRTDRLPKLLLYSLNPTDWVALASLAGSFEGEYVQRIHFGCAWWFNDTFTGIMNQLTTYAEQSLLGNFVGMLTDSRSFLSYPRHEYFRRILCRVLGQWIEGGRLPEDETYLSGVVKDISYRNAHDYFGFFTENDR